MSGRMMPRLLAAGGCAVLGVLLWMLLRSASAPTPPAESSASLDPFGPPTASEILRALAERPLHARRDDAWARFTHGDWASARVDFEQLVEEAPTLTVAVDDYATMVDLAGDPDLRDAAMAFALDRQGRAPDDALAVYLESRLVGLRDPDRAMARALDAVHLGCHAFECSAFVTWLMLQVGVPPDEGQEMLTVAADARHPATAALLLMAAGDWAGYTGSMSALRGIEHFRDGWRHAVSVRWPLAHRARWLLLTHHQGPTRDERAAVAHTQMSVRFAALIGDRPLESVGRAKLGVALMFSARVAPGIAEAEPACGQMDADLRPAARLACGYELALVRSMSGDLDAATAELDRTAAIKEALQRAGDGVAAWGGPYNPFHGQRAYGLEKRRGLVHLERGDVDAAIAAARRAARLNPNGHDVQLLLGKALTAARRYDEAEVHLEMAKRLSQGQGFDMYLAAESALIRLLELRQDPRALGLLGRLLDETSAHYPGVREIPLLVRIGRLLGERDMLDRADESLRRAHRFALDAGLSRQGVRSLVTLASVHLEHHRLAEAHQLLVRADRWRRQLAEDDPVAAEVSLVMARLEHARRMEDPAHDLAPAWRMVSRAQDLGDAHTRRAANMLRIELALAAGQLRAARRAAQGALALGPGDSEGADLEHARLLLLAARAEQASGESARSLLSAARRVVDDLRASVAGQADPKLDQREVELLELEVAEEMRRGSAEGIERAFELAERARWLSSTAPTRTAGRTDAPNTRLAVARRMLDGRLPAADEQALLTELLDAALADEARRALPGEQPLSRRARRLADLRERLTRDALDPDERRALVAWFNRAQSPASTAAPTVGASAGASIGTGTSLTSLRSRLDAATTVVAYLTGPDRGFAWIVRKRGVEVVELPGRAQLRRLIELAERRWSSPDTRLESVWAASEALAATLLGEARTGLAEGGRLVVVPYGDIDQVPFEALLSSRTARGVVYLLDRVDVGYAASASLPARERPSPAPSHMHGPVLLFGDPIYDTDPCEVERRPPQSRWLARRDGRGDLQWARLCHSKAEIDALRGLSSHPGDVVLTRERATEAALRAQPLSDFAVLHFATHGVLVDREVAFSALVLGRDDDPYTDGYLDLREIAGLHLDADLVTLSACRTAHAPRGDRAGVGSLSKAFLQSGARQVLAARWQVADRMTARLMAEVYARWRSVSLVEALASVRREIREGRFGEEGRHPYYWAPWALTTRWLGVSPSASVGRHSPGGGVPTDVDVSSSGP